MGPAVEQLPCFKDLISVLIECFLIIGLGYLSVSLKLVSPQAKDINSYLTNLALPMIIFLNIAQMELQKINMSFLICMLIGKLIVFVTVTTLTLATSYPRNFGYAGILSILSTQSNDFALGYPLIKSLYNDPQKKMLSYLSLMAPIQLLILNPVGVVMMEYNKTQLLKKNRSRQRYNQKGCKCFMGASSSSNRAMIESSTSTRVKIVGDDKSSTVEPPPANSFSTQLQPSRTSSNQESSGFARHRLVNRKPLAAINTNCNDNQSACSAETTLDSASPTSKRQMFNISRHCQTTGHHDSSTSLTSQNSTLGTCDNNLIKSSSEEQLADDSLGKPVMVCHCKCVAPTKSRAGLSFLAALATNPIIVASLVGLLVNQTYGSTLPKFVTKVANTIAASFAAPAMFVVGVSLYGKFQLLLKNPTDLLLSSVLVLTKELMLSNLFRTITLVILPYYMAGDELKQLTDFSFLYGLLPNAPNASVLANQYGLLTNVVSTCMLLSTLFSAPLIFVTALIINRSSVLENTLSEQSLSNVTKFLSSMILSLALVVVYSVLRVAKTRRFDPECPPVAPLEEERIEEARPPVTDSPKNPARVFLILLVVSQVLVGIGGVTRFFIKEQESVIGHVMPTLPIVIPQIVAQHNFSTTRLEAFVANPPSNDETSSESNGIFSHLLAIEPVNQNPEVSELQQTSSDISRIWLNRFQYSLSCYGIIMGRVIVMGFAMTLVVAENKGLEKGKTFASYLLKTHHLIAIGLILSLIFTPSASNEDKITDASLPDTSSALYIRMAINLLFMSIVLPALVWMVRRNNKERLKLLEDIFYIKKNFISSKNATPSESSSAVTLNTCLDSSSPNNNTSTQILEINNNQANLDDSLLITLESSCSEQKFTERQAPSFDPKTSSVNDTIATNKSTSITNDLHDLDGQTFGNRLLCDLGSSLNRHSILLVIMIFNSCYNLITVSQKLIQHDTFGTFRQIEMTNICLEFSQSIWTYLIYRGATGLFD